MVTKVLLCSLAGLAALGVNTAAQLQTAPLVRVESGELQGQPTMASSPSRAFPSPRPQSVSCGGGHRSPPPWTGVREAAEFGADCMQGRFGPPPLRRAGCARGAAGCLGSLLRGRQKIASS